MKIPHFSNNEDLHFKVTKGGIPLRNFSIQTN